MSQYLVIPVSGVAHVHDYPVEQDELWIRRTLSQWGRGSMIGLGIIVDEKPGGRVHFLHHPSGPVNPRAREALAHLTGLHMLFTGAVMFSGIPEHRVTEAVALVSSENLS